MNKNDLSYAQLLVQVSLELTRGMLAFQQLAQFQPPSKDDYEQFALRVKKLVFRVRQRHNCRNS